MKRYIVTGTPGSGKTSIVRALEMAGHVVVEEAATDIIALEQAQGIAEPWTAPSFIDKIVHLQKQRQMRAAELSATPQFFDRSPICTQALCTFLGYAVSPALSEELARCREAAVYQREVFFIENLGSCEPTAARRISFEDSLRFERVHEETYDAFGYACIRIPPRPLAERVAEIAHYVSALL